MFGSLSKKGREIESDTWQGSLPGQHAREAGPHPGQALPGQPLAGVLAEARSGCAAGLCSGWKVGRPPAGNGKAQTLVMAGLLCLCIDVNNRRGICNFLPKMLRFPVTASECVLEPLLEPSCHHCLTLASSEPRAPLPQIPPSVSLAVLTPDSVLQVPLPPFQCPSPQTLCRAQPPCLDSSRLLRTHP